MNLINITKHQSKYYSALSNTTKTIRHWNHFETCKHDRTLEESMNMTEHLNTPWIRLNTGIIYENRTFEDFINISEHFETRLEDTITKVEHLKTYEHDWTHDDYEQDWRLRLYEQDWKH